MNRKTSFVNIKNRPNATICEKMVINPDGSRYQAFVLVKVLASVIEFIIYPFIMILDLSDLELWVICLILFAQAIFIIDIILNFLLAIKKQNFGGEYMWNPKEIAKTYFKKGFLIDVILTIPWGFIGNLKNLNIIKAFRAREVVKVMQTRVYNDRIRRFYEFKLEGVMKDEIKMFDIKDQQTFIDQRINSQNVMHVLKMILILTGLIFFTTIIWDFAVLYFHQQQPEKISFWTEYNF